MFESHFRRRRAKKVEMSEELYTPLEDGDEGNVLNSKSLIANLRISIRSIYIADNTQPGRIAYKARTPKLTRAAALGSRD